MTDTATADTPLETTGSEHHGSFSVADVCGEHPFSIEGRDEGSWILMDYGSVIVHVFSPEARDYYRLERLWGDAPVLDLGF